MVIIGGGITGVGIARDLSRRGYQVALIEKGEIGNGATINSHGLLHSGARYAETDPGVARDCIKENRILKQIARGCIEETGGYFVLVKGDEEEYFHKKIIACEECEIENRVISKEKMIETIPTLSPRIDRGMAVPDSVVFPEKIVSATANNAKKHGARIFENTKISGVKKRKDSIESIEMETRGIKREIRGEYLINAGGAWAGEIARLLGSSMEMKPTRGAMVEVDHGVEKILNRCRPASDGDIIIPRYGKSIIGTTSVPIENLDEKNGNEKEIQELIDECALMCPKIKFARVNRVYWGIRPLKSVGTKRSRDRKEGRGFQITNHEEIENLISITGGKLTTYRLMAERVSDEIAEMFGNSEDCRTHLEPL